MSNPTISKGFTWTNGATAMPTRMNNAVDEATIQCTQTDVVIGRSTSGAGEAEEISFTGAMRTLAAKATLAAQKQLLGGASIARVSAQFDKTVTTLADITGLSVNVDAAATYSFEVILFVDQDGTGGSKIALSGTATATAIIADAHGFGSGTATSFTRLTALNSTATRDFFTTVRWEIRGTVTVNQAGTFTVQFAQQTATGTSSVLVGSYLRVWQY